MNEERLAHPPADPRGRELWLQHAAGHILFRDVRAFALAQMDPSLSPEACAAAVKAVNDALYGVMMVADGVTGALRNEEHTVQVGLHVHLLEGESVREEIDLFRGDGMCMGYHGWQEGDFGSSPVVT